MVESKKWNGGRFTKGVHWTWIVVLVVVIVGFVAVGLATSSGGGSSSSSAASGLCSDKLTQMEASGAMATMVQTHQSMLEQMRAGLSPQMQQLMDADPMWKSMRSGDWTQMFQDQQQQIDRMLGSTAKCGAR